MALALVLALLGSLALAPAGAAAAPPNSPFGDPRASGFDGDSSGQTRPRSCENLTSLRLPETAITSASVNSTGTFQPPPGSFPAGPLTGLPAFCRVTLTVQPQINIEVWLPLAPKWNGRFQAVGGGGYAGSISFGALATALQGGYATASTDTGHSATQQPGGSFGLTASGQLNWQFIIDFASRSEHEMTVQAKAILEAFYGQTARYSYWNGCSTGGRQGLMEAQRFPEDYDGILAGAPAINWPEFIPAEFWPQLVMLQKHDFVSQCKFNAVNAAAVAACDGLDGVVDGVIDDPRLCHFDPGSLVGTTTPCGETFTATDADVVRAIWQGPRGPNGEFLWYGLEPGASFAGLANTVDSSDGIPFPIATDWIKYFLLRNPSWDWHTATYPQFVQWFHESVAEFSDVIGTNDPNLWAFRGHGGKLIIWHGWADQLIFPRGTINYYERLEQVMGGERSTQEFARLFMAPGVGHCGGGAGPNPVDPFSAVVNWVEHHQAPDTLLATNAVESRPLCPYPLEARYTDQGSAMDAANFVCRPVSSASDDKHDKD
ncbi:MAG: tannase/feruloyl esterase family alpha/beta hydrolase [Chloroflexi bacterium]|nr:tannase/feruloyl esterase family alpha/beta hydrolase [Chloroflexota bacterium]MBV9598191.1 tannase/feruloyl esterase family alpha/beta hydrolase [Chloroflexota bacterium]